MALAELFGPEPFFTMNMIRRFPTKLLSAVLGKHSCEPCPAYMDECLGARNLATDNYPSFALFFECTEKFRLRLLRLSKGLDLIDLLRPGLACVRAEVYPDGLARCENFMLRPLLIPMLPHRDIIRTLTSTVDFIVDSVGKDAIHCIYKEQSRPKASK